MDRIIDISFLPFFLSFVISYAITPFVIKYARKLGILDDPKKNKSINVIHTYPVPRGGGIPIFFGSIISILIFLPLDRHIVGIIIGSSILLVMGFWDDKRSLNPYLRFVIQFIAASIPVFSGIGITFLTDPFGGGVVNLAGTLVSDLFSIMWIVFMMNMLNMGAKGIDGQLPGVVVIASAIIAALSLRFSADITQWPVIILAFIVCGAFLGFLPWNFYPQQIMPGFGGSTLAGYFLAILSIISTTKVGTILVALGIPMVDTGYTIVRRIISGKSPFWGDRGHLHHRLLDSGMSKVKVTLFYWILTAGLGIIALYLNTSSKLYTIIGISIVVGGLLLWLTYKPKKGI